MRLALPVLAVPALAILALAPFAPIRSAQAQNIAPPSAPALPDGQTLLSISATERAQVAQDVLVATLRIEKTGHDATKVQAEINALMKTALARAEAVPGVEVSNGGYYVYEEDLQPRPITQGEKQTKPEAKTWRGSQSLELKSKTPDALLKLAGELQGLGLMVSGMNYTLSPEKADAVRDGLLESALKKLKTRAERAAKALGKTKTDLVDVDVNASNNFVRPYPVMRAMAMAAPAAKMDAPSAAPGETEITLTVSARALLKP